MGRESRPISFYYIRKIYTYYNDNNFKEVICDGRKQTQS